MPKEVGYYVPEPPPKPKKVNGNIQTNDVDLDYRGLIYITDRGGASLHVLEYQGRT